MSPLPEAILAVLVPFAPLFSRPVWIHVQVLLVGAILCQGSRTVAAVLRVMGLGQVSGFCRYHRVLSRARWSGLRAAQILLGLLLAVLPETWTPAIVADETVERRKGRRIRAKGCYRDAVRSTPSQVVKCLGLKWISLTVLVRLPWCSRPWALPFLTILAPSERANRAAGRRHKTSGDWTRQAVKVVARWLGTRRWVLIGDGAYASVRLGHTVVAHRGVLISRLRLDAQLYEFPDPTAPRRRGPKPQKGVRMPALAHRVAAARHHGFRVEMPWYGGATRPVCVLSGVALWHTAGVAPLPIRWVLMVSADGDPQPAAFFSTCTALLPGVIVRAYIGRWNGEVTLEEVRRHLGVETQRQWSDQAIARTTPALFGLFSLVCLMGLRLFNTQSLTPQATAWYPKTEATFADVLAAVRRHLWAGRYFVKSTPPEAPVELPPQDWETILDQLSAAA